jgi:hypothetical protein
MDFTSLMGQLFPGRYHAHLSAGADQRVRTDLVVDGHDRELSFWLPAEGARFASV